MPGKPRKTIPGFLSLHELAIRAKQKGNTISVTGFKRALREGKLVADAYENRRYKPGPLFFTRRENEWILKAPKPNQEISNGYTTTHHLLAEANKIRGNIYLPHIQQFLKELQSTQPELAAQMRVETNGKRKRLIIPQAIADQFLERVRTNQLSGLFRQYGSLHRGQRNPKKPPSPDAPTPKPAPSPTPVPPTPEPNTPIPHPSAPTPKIHGPLTTAEFLQLESRFNRPVVQMRIAQDVQQLGSSRTIEETARLLGTTVGTLHQLVETGKLEKKPNSKIPIQSIQRLL